MRLFTAVAILMLVFISCEEKPSQAELDDTIIQNYLSDNNKSATKHSSGIYYTIVEEGFGDSPNLLSTVDVAYKGYLINNYVFDSTAADTSISFPLYTLIPGWQIGIPMLKTEGKGIFYIPSELGYGANNIGEIPANSVLIFEIELLGFWQE